MRESKKDGLGKACLPGGAEAPQRYRDRTAADCLYGTTARVCKTGTSGKEKYLPDVPASVLNEMGEKPLLSARRMAVRLRVYQ